MSRIRIESKGDFSKTDRFFDKISDIVRYVDLRKYGKQGVDALKNATPKDSGETANSWRYEIIHNKETKTYSLTWYNDNIADGQYNIAILLQYGHATNNGGYVKGRDYINPALAPIFEKIAEDAWKEVTDS